LNYNHSSNDYANFKRTKITLSNNEWGKTITTLSKEMNLSIYRTSTLTGKLAKKGLITITKNGKLQVYPNLKIMDCR
jgi:predicted transcriptional regulator